MLLPQYSLRTILAIVSAAAGLSLVLARAAAGPAWAVGVATGVASLLAAGGAYAVFFGICTAFSRILGAEQVVVRTSRGGVQQEHATNDNSPPAAPLVSQSRT